jgi:FemAB-related protein (PEP-CTERM system-associated)
VSPLRVRIATESDERRWDNYVNNHPEATPYHLSAWIKAVTKAYGFTGYTLLAEVEGDIKGGITLVHMGIPLKPKSIISLPYCDVGGILAEEGMVVTSLLSAVYDLAHDKQARGVALRGALPVQGGDLQENIQKLPTNKVRMILPLPNSSKELWDGFKSKLRSQIKKAKNNGLTFVFNNDRIDDFYSVVSHNMRDLGSPVHSKGWFQEIVYQYGDNAKIALVRYEHKVIGAAIILRVGDKISIPWASTLRTYNKLSPNMLLYWGVLEYSVNNGCSSFDFGRSTPQEGTYKFKKQWGAIEHPLEWYSWPIDGSDNEKKYLANSGKRDFIEDMWKRLPLVVANKAGSLLRKYIDL